MDDIYIDKVLNGDTEAFRYFLTNYKDMAFNVAVSIVKDEHYAEEVIQDAFMKAFKGLKSFNREAKFKSWFYRIVINESFQRLRKIKKGKELVDFDETIDPNINSIDELPENYKIDKIRAALGSLSVNESLVLNLFYLEESSLLDICNMTGWTLSNTKVILHRARKNIRILMGISLDKNE